MSIDLCANILARCPSESEGVYGDRDREVFEVVRTYSAPVFPGVLCIISFLR